MKQYIIYSDIHKYAPQFTGHTVNEMIDKHYNDNNVILTGDIVDAKNCKRWSEKSKSSLDILILKRHFGERYLLGNHEVQTPENYYIVIDNILFMHGHTIFWSEEKVKRWENKKIGQSKFHYYKYRAYKAFKKRKNKKLHPSEKHLRIIQDLLIRHDCHTVVFGHSHRNYDVTYDWGRVVNVPQGRSVLSL